MRRFHKQEPVTALVILILIIVAYFCWLWNDVSTPYSRVFSLIRAGIYIGLFTAWGFSVRRRIIQKQLRCCLIAIAMLMVFWVSVRTIKYNYVHDRLLEHRLWYLYYLPLIYIPLLSLFVAKSVCRGEEYRLPPTMFLMFIPALLLVILVQTNDTHEFVFSFIEDHPGREWDVYEYRWGYFIIVGWIALCFTIMIGVLFERNRMSDKKRRILIPMGILFLLGLYSLMYGLSMPWTKVFMHDYPVSYCLILLAFFTSLFRLNLIPSNSHYRELFEYTSVPTIIVDEEYRPKIASSSYVPISSEKMRQAETEPILMEGKEAWTSKEDNEAVLRLSSAKLKDGHVLWQENISPLIRLSREMEQTKVSIQEQTEAEMEAYKAAYLRRQLEEKNRLYDRLQKRTRHKILHLQALVSEFETTSDPQKEELLLKTISTIGAFIKRRSNVIFLAEDQERIDAKELKNCLQQSLDSLTLFGIEAEQEFQVVSDMSLTAIAQLYEWFEEIVEGALPTLNELFVSVQEKAGNITVELRVSCEESLHEVEERVRDSLTDAATDSATDSLADALADTAKVSVRSMIKEIDRGEWLAKAMIRSGGESE